MHPGGRRASFRPSTSSVGNVTGDLSCAAFVARSEGETLTPRPVDHRLEPRPVTGGVDRGVLDGILQ